MSNSMFPVTYPHWKQKAEKGKITMNIESLAKSLYESLKKKKHWCELRDYKKENFRVQARYLNRLYFIKEVKKREERYKVDCDYCDFGTGFTQSEIDNLETEDNEKICPNCGCTLRITLV